MALPCWATTALRSIPPEVCSEGVGVAPPGMHSEGAEGGAVPPPPSELPVTPEPVVLRRAAVAGRAELDVEYAAEAKATVVGRGVANTRPADARKFLL